MDVRVGLWRKLSTEELMLLNCGVGEDSESPLDCKEMQLVHSKGDQFWLFFERNDAEAETPVLWPPHVKSWLIGKDSDAGRDWGQEEKGTTEDEMAGWHHWLDGRELEWTPGVGDGQGGLACCNSWGHKELEMTERLNWTELNWRLSPPKFFQRWVRYWDILAFTVWEHSVFASRTLLAGSHTAYFSAVSQPWKRTLGINWTFPWMKLCDLLLLCNALWT